MHKTALAFMLYALVGVGLIYGYSVERRTVQSLSPLKQQPKQDKRREASRSVFEGLRNPHSQKLDEAVAIAKGEVRIERELGLPMLTPGSSFDLMSFLSKRACDADAIVVGRVTKGVSDLTEDGSFIYTAFDVEIDDVLKDNVGHALTTGEAILVLRTGGAIELSGKRIVAEDKSATSLESGERYLLFLTYFPERSTYAADNLTYRLKNKKILKLTEQTLDPALESGNDANSFMASVRAAVTAPCQ